MSEKLWGAEAIGAAINRNPKQTYHLLSKGLIRSAKRVGKRWVVDKDDLQREFSAAGAKAQLADAQPQPTAREMRDSELNKAVGDLIHGRAHS
jgi:hypothetical protein